MTDKNIKKAELLSPAGDMQSLKAAVNAGCDAVYFGGQSFNARRGALNFSDDEIKDAIDYCHLRGVRANIALNILYKDSEIDDVMSFVSMLYRLGADALIIQDIGIFSLIKYNFPKFKLYASTQMTAHNKNAAEFLTNIGFDRVVLSRELSLCEIKYIKEHTNTELETFIHGAVCVSYSGRCLMSSVIGGRSANRGLCAQPCRLKYKLFAPDNGFVKDGCLLSPKDMSALPILNELCEAGISSFKIEGRMKSPEYVAVATSVYRKYLDKVYSGSFDIDSDDQKALLQIFNRGGSFETGYYHNYAGSDMLSSSPKSSGRKIGIVEDFNKKTGKCIIKLYDDVFCGDGIEIFTRSEPHSGSNICKNASKGEKITIKISGNINKGDLVYKSFDKTLNDSLKRFLKKDKRQLTIDAELKAVLGEKFKICFSFGSAERLIIEEDIIQKAENAPLTKENLLLRLSKTGDSTFKFNFVKSEVGDDIYIPIKQINEIKRKAVNELADKLIKYYRRENIQYHYNASEPKKAESRLSVLVNSFGQLEQCLKFDVKRIYIEYKDEFLGELDNIIKKCHKKNIEIYAALPWIERDIYKNDTKKAFDLMEDSLLDGYLIRNYGQLNTKKSTAADFTFNIFNSASCAYLGKFFDTLCLSPELSVKELKNMAADKTEIFVYGRLPLMTTHQCPVGIHCAAKKSGAYCSLKNKSKGYYIKDRKNISFPLATDCKSCECIILNSAAVFVLKKFDEIKQLGAEFFRLNLTDEDDKLSEELIYSHLYMLSHDKPDLRTQELINKFSAEKDATNGHFFRGVL